MKESFKNAYLEDYQVGKIYKFGFVLVDKEEVISFAKKFDPQFFHIEETLANSSQFKGIIASGWHTCSMMMRLLVDNYISECSSLGSPGVEKIRWTEPVRPGDILSLKVRVLQSRPSESKPDRGIVKSKIEMFNQKKVTVLEMETTGFFLSRKTSK